MILNEYEQLAIIMIVMFIILEIMFLTETSNIKKLIKKLEDKKNGK